MPPPIEDRIGFWGPTTSTIDWCEYNYEVTTYIAEFWNTVTNLWMIIPPIYGIITAHKQSLETRFIVCYLALLSIGIGSWMFHMTLQYEMQLMDEIPMVFGAAGLTYCIYQVRQPAGKTNLVLILLLLVYCGLFVVVYLVINKPLFHEVIYGILVGAMVLLDLDLTRKQYSSSNVKVLIVGMLMYATGFVLWSVDNVYCGSLRSFRAQHPLLSPLTQLHGWWHACAGYATYLQIVAVAYQRQRFLEKECKYAVGLVGLTIETRVDQRKRK